MIKADKWTDGLSITIEVIDDKQKPNALKVSKVLKKLSQEELPSKDNAIWEKLLLTLWKTLKLHMMLNPKSHASTIKKY